MRPRLPVLLLPALSLASLFLACALPAGALAALEVGEKAPALKSAAWVKNGPAEVGSGVTVVEFWATWCGPCRESIPHLTKLARQHAGKVTVVGLSNEDEEAVKPFVTKQGAAMDYHVGVADEALSKSYMDGHDGIPFSFLVGADGVVLWAGHPMAIDGVLDAVVGGTFDAKAEAARAKNREELRALLQEEADDQQGLMARITAKATAILREDAGDDLALGVLVGVAKHRHDRGAVRAAYAGLPLATLGGARAAEIAEAMAGDPEAADRHLDLAWAFAERAVAAAPQAAGSFAAAAHVRYALGLLDEAIAAQEQAVKIDPDQAADLGFYREAKRLRDLVKAGQPPTAPAGLPAPLPAPTAAETPTARGPASPAGTVP